MTTTDPWQMIFDKAGHIFDSLLHELPKSKFDAIDFNDKVESVVKELASGEVNPREDWSVIIRSTNKKVKLDEKIDDHFEIALRQAMFVRVLFEFHMQKIKEQYSESSQPGMLMKIGEEMLAAFACAQQHATAWRLLTQVRDKSYEVRSQKAAQVKIDKKEEREALLRSLIETHLGRLRPKGGWRSHILAAQQVSIEVASIAESLSLPISSDQDELSEKVQMMIWKEPRLRKAYNENAKEPLDEPIKSRRVYVKEIFSEEEEV
ncbi:hypothetical protein GPM19_13985 [Halomonas sp. ZH2S]|uniref:Uncharacterized protein n=1 Tax=Vreelandella zhuhanensis TaxID=2684210 RepID=A0A7X3H2F9_9GAMM|nr:hypothetical protein [Halomonas zhuhanensis]MWJ29291.1 hypothetical protein [Halomonas zhuhanensis]